MALLAGSAAIVFIRKCLYLLRNTIEDIAAACGLHLTAYNTVRGGDINECFQLQADGKYFFLKLNDAGSLRGMFAAEAEGLKELRNSSTIIIPQVIQQGITQNQQWLLLQWIEKGSTLTDSLKNFGAALARMHQLPQACFGWPRHNYIGSLQQLNTQHSSWASFYTYCRIMPLVKLLVDAALFSAEDLQQAGAFCTAAGNLFPHEPPALLHGDLWAGNYMITTAGGAAVYDPAVYYGHREMDIGMAALFGGFSQAFYDGYNEVYPLQQDWRQRLPLTQLYPLLVHAVLFGGHYVDSARAI